MSNWKDLQIALTSSDRLSSDIIADELYGEIISLQKCFTFELSDPKSVLEYMCRNELIEIYPTKDAKDSIGFTCNCCNS